MAETVTLYDATGQTWASAAPSEIARMEKAGWQRTPPTGEQLAAAAIAQQRAEAEVTGAPLPAAPAPVVVEPEGIIIAAVETEAPAEKPKRTRK